MTSLRPSTWWLQSQVGGLAPKRSEAQTFSLAPASCGSEGGSRSGRKYATVLPSRYLYPCLSPGG